jgi:hypothetical protein
VNVIEDGEENLATGDKFDSQSNGIVRDANLETFDSAT